MTLHLEILIVAIFSIIPHELAHGVVALALGDDTAHRAGRLSVNPLRHISLVGTILLPAALLAISGGHVMLGWLKPIPVNSANFRDARRDMFRMALAGPAMNLALSAIFWGLSSVVDHPLLVIGGVMNAALCAVNLIPIKPFDGWHIARYFFSLGKEQTEHGQLQ